MKELLPAIVTGVTYPPNLVVNQKRKYPFDVYEGEASVHQNQHFKYSRLNATFLESSTIGDCYSNGTCTGIFETLRNREADLSVHPIPIDFPPGFNINSTHPAIVGPMTGEMSIQFLSLPYRSAYKRNSDILATFEQCSWSVNAIHYFLFILIYILLNVSVRIKGGKINLAHGHKVSWINLAGMCMKQYIIPVKKPHRILISAGLIIYSAFLTAVLAGLFQSNMVYEYPPQYYSSLEEIVDKVHTKSVITIDGLFVQSKLIRKASSTFQRLNKISQTYKRQTFLEISGHVVQGRVLLSVIPLINLVHALTCSVSREVYLLARESEPVYKSFTYTLFSSTASNELKKRYSRYLTLYFESGIQDYFSSRQVAVEASSLLTEDPMALYRCLSSNSMIKRPSASFNAFSYVHFEPLFRITSYLFALIMIIHAIELVFGIWSSGRAKTAGKRCIRNSNRVADVWCLIRIKRLKSPTN